jgi:hypothetical protein
MHLDRSTLKSLTAVALVCSFIAGCRFFDMIGLAKPKNDSVPFLPCAATLAGPCLVLRVPDSTLALAQNEEVSGDIYATPVTRYSKPVNVYSDTSQRLVSLDPSIVSVDGTTITARAQGTADLRMTGFEGNFPVSANLAITVRVK